MVNSNLNSYSDYEVIQKILGGEIGLYEILIRRYNSSLYKTGRSYNYSHEDTQDLMQDTFVDAYTGLSGFESRSSFKTWITKIMLNNCFRKMQKSAFKNELSSEIHDSSIPMFTNPNSSDTNKFVTNDELSVVIENALKQVPQDYRLVFSLREISGFNVQETADALNISEANVKVRLNRAKAMLRSEIEKTYSKEEIFEFNLIYCNKIVERVMSRINNLK